MRSSTKTLSVSAGVMASDSHDKASWILLAGRLCDGVELTLVTVWLWK